jgi:5'-phosphate synthase pdxT subunit|tara:strand:+ start:164 stop:898 length:735 start_codon:yes stop_codon:yes gene_type:complete
MHPLSNERIDVEQLLAAIMALRIGIAMLQGARHEHAQAIHSAAKQLSLQVETIELRTSADLNTGLDALILPGGESTTMRLASRSKGLLEAIYDWLDEHPEAPVIGTCAGAILLCDPPEGRHPFIDAKIERNSFGRQFESFQAELEVALNEESSEPVEEMAYVDKNGHTPLKVETTGNRNGFPGVFIRAPRFKSCADEEIVHLGSEVVGVSRNNRIALTFHPELTDDHLFHRWLLRQSSAAQERN